MITQQNSKSQRIFQKRMGFDCNIWELLLYVSYGEWSLRYVYSKDLYMFECRISDEYILKVVIRMLHS